MVFWSVCWAYKDSIDEPVVLFFDNAPVYLESSHAIMGVAVLGNSGSGRLHSQSPWRGPGQSGGKSCHEDILDEGGSARDSGFPSVVPTRLVFVSGD